KILSGSCVGDAVGTCNCAACSSFVACQDDSVCGGLRGACNKQTGQCDCERGLHSLHFIQHLPRFLIAQFNATNFPSFNPNGSYFDALMFFCNIKRGVPNTDKCFGLPCNSGLCACS
ncbi:unnamed protein product, partial [Anisakis simplex]|uniref:EB domain-containing protein n=1 Tax=Anisakis simplex TaxID=6269 RepID=A0A0M3JB01_ANISI